MDTFAARLKLIKLNRELGRISESEAIRQADALRVERDKYIESLRYGNNPYAKVGS